MNQNLTKMNVRNVLQISLYILFLFAFPLSAQDFGKKEKGNVKIDEKEKIEIKTPEQFYEHFKSKFLKAKLLRVFENLDTDNPDDMQSLYEMRNDNHEHGFLDFTITDSNSYNLTFGENINHIVKYDSNLFLTYTFDANEALAYVEDFRFIKEKEEDPIYKNKSFIIDPELRKSIGGFTLKIVDLNVKYEPILSGNRKGNSTSYLARQMPFRKIQQLNDQVASSFQFILPRLKVEFYNTNFVILSEFDSLTENVTVVFPK